MTNLFPPFEPEGEERRWRRFRPVPFRVLLPNLITLLALCLGLTAIRMAIEGRYDYAVAAIVVAAVLDGLDGRIARLLQSTSRFGAELDSLADFVSFGVAPAIVLYMWGLGSLRSVGWIAVLVFAICAGLRLARFNVMLDDPNRPPYAANFFVGMPAPAGAIVVMLPGLSRIPRHAAHLRARADRARLRGRDRASYGVENSHLVRQAGGLSASRASTCCSYSCSRCSSPGSCSAIPGKS